MKKYLFSLPLAAGLILAGCGDDEGNNQVISKRYIHKYGYAVSGSDWEGNNYPGQVITTLRNGVTITSTYENGVLHGPCTHTHPHSQTVQYFYLYNNGELKKELVYDSFGMPTREKVQLSPHRYCVTTWYGDGTPGSIEDYADDELLDAEYFTLNHEVESRVQRGNGMRTRRDQHGVLLSKDYIESGYLVKRETFFPSGNLESIAAYKMNKKNGERKVFSEMGEPSAIEQWFDDQLNGRATYFANGRKLMDVYFVGGARHGTETHYIDGETIEQEIQWNSDKRHGVTKFYVGNTLAKTEWYYNGKPVTKKRFDELDMVDQMLSQAPAD